MLHRGTSAGAQTLIKLRDKIDPTRMKKPSLLMVFVGIGEIAYHREGGKCMWPRHGV